jgi:hypothetical protein
MPATIARIRRYGARSSVSPAVLALVLALALALVLAANPAAAAWQRVNGPVPPPVAEFVAHHGLWYLGTNFADQGDLFVSSDGGHTWNDAGLPNGGVSAVLSHADRLFVGGYLSGLWWSDDDGGTWEQAGPPLSFSTVEALLPVDDQTLLAGLDPFGLAPLFRSEDNGLSWDEVDTGPTLRCHDLALAGGVILAGGQDQGVWRSVDGGVTWNQTFVGLPADASVYRFAVDGATVFAAAGANVIPPQVYRSDDLGATWTQVSVDLPSAGSQATLLAFLGGDLYLGTAGTFGERGLYRSSNGGVNWTRISAGLPGDDPSVHAAAIMDGELVAGCFAGAYRSSDGGQSWAPTWAGSAGVGGGHSLLYSADRLHIGLDFTGQQSQGVLATPDLGDTWQPGAGIPANTTAYDLTGHDGVIYAALYGPFRGVGISHDGGHSYALSNQGMNPGTVLYCVHAHDGVLLAGGFDGVYRSVDDGTSWDLIDSIGWVSDLVSLDGFVYASLYPGGVERSADAGLTWEPITEGMGADVHVNALEIFDGTVYAAVNVGPVMRWNGASWDDTGLNGAVPYDLAAVGEVLVAGTALDGVWITTGTHQWLEFSAGLTGGIIEAVTATPEYLVAGSRSRGIWIRPLSELPVTTGVEEAALPAAAVRVDVAPNPFNPLTAVSYELPRAGYVTVAVFDAAGRRVRQLLDGPREAGRHLLRWDGRDDAGRAVAAGVYLVRVAGQGEVAVAKAVLVR